MIQIDLDFSRFASHFVDVRMEFCAKHDSPTLCLPIWIAGSYLVRDFAKYISFVTYKIDGISYRATKTQKNHWQLTHAKAKDTIQVAYEVYCHDLSVRTAYVDNQRIFGNFTSLLMTINNDTTPCEVTLSVPNDFFAINPNSELVCGLPATTVSTPDGINYRLKPNHAFELYDYPFEIAPQNSFSFDVINNDKAVEHRFFVSGLHQMDKERLKKDLTTICQSYVDVLGWVPFDDYTFMTHATGNEYGGLEHINSTALITPRADLPSHFEEEIPSPAYQRFLGLCSHEYFHAWWVKSVRPDIMMDNDLQSEAYTTLLWVFEGFTSYIDNLMLYISGVIDQKSYLNLLASDIARFYNTEGRHHQSLAESSFDTWIKLYQPNENSPNRTVSYYNKGTLVALCLDLLLLKHSRYRLFDVVKYFSNQAHSSHNQRIGMTDDHLGEVIGSMLGEEIWQDFYESYIIGTKELPLAELLASQDIYLENLTTEYKPWGLNTETTALGLCIKTAHPESPAVKSGLSVGDTIIALDGIKADKNRLSSLAQIQYRTHQSVHCHAFRRDELMHFVIKDVNEQTLFPTHKVTLKNPSGMVPDWLALA